MDRNLGCEYRAGAAEAFYFAKATLKVIFDAPGQ
jgi:hypothetical protein